MAYVVVDLDEIAKKRIRIRFSNPYMSNRPTRPVVLDGNDISCVIPRMVTFEWEVSELTGEMMKHRKLCYVTQLQNGQMKVEFIKGWRTVKRTIDGEYVVTLRPPRHSKIDENKLPSFHKEGDEE